MNGNKIKKTTVQRQNASEIGGTNSTPPLATTLTRSMMIGFLDVIPVYLLMGAAIIMMIYEAFFDKD